MKYFYKMNIISLLLCLLPYWYGTYLGETKVGYIRREVDTTAVGYKFSELQHIELNMMGVRRVATSFVVYHTDKELKINEFTFEFRSEAQHLICEGTVDDGSLLLDITTDAGHSDKRVTLREPLYALTILPFIAVREGNLTDRYLLFDPTTLSVEYATVNINRGDTLELTINFLGTTTHMWVDTTGVVLKEEGPMGVLSKLEPESLATKLAGETREIMAFAAIPTNVTISHPRRVKYLKAIVKGEFLQDERQSLRGDTLIVRVVEPIPPYRVIEGHTEATPLIQADDPQIKRLARKVTRWSINNWSRVQKLVHWVSDYVEDFPTVSVPSAVDVLKWKKGDCNEHAVLFCALARALGIPCEIVAGIVYMEGGFYYHAWNRVYVGRWVDVDPTFDQALADATHIGLVLGGLEHQAKIMELVGKIKIEILEYKE